MRFLAISSVMALAACATAPVLAPPIAETAATPVTPRPSRALQVLSSAGGAGGPSEGEVQRALGEPAIRRQDGAGAALTYRFDSCALLLLFEADERHVLRLARVHTSARRGNDTPPSLEQCAAEAPAS